MGWQSRIEEFRNFYHDCISIGCSMATSQDEVTVDLAFEARCDLGESPVWDGKTNTLYFVVSLSSCRDCPSVRCQCHRLAPGVSWISHGAERASGTQCGDDDAPCVAVRRGSQRGHQASQPCVLLTSAFDPHANISSLQSPHQLQDINGRTIHGFQPETGEHFTIKADEPTGTIVPTNDPTKILVATQRDILVVDVPGRKVTKQAIATTPEEHGTGAGFELVDALVLACVLGWFRSQRYLLADTMHCWGISAGLGWTLQQAACYLFQLCLWFPFSAHASHAHTANPPCRGLQVQRRKGVALRDPPDRPHEQQVEERRAWQAVPTRPRL